MANPFIEAVDHLNNAESHVINGDFDKAEEELDKADKIEREEVGPRDFNKVNMMTQCALRREWMEDMKQKKDFDLANAVEELETRMLAFRQANSIGEKIKSLAEESKEPSMEILHPEGKACSDAIMEYNKNVQRTLIEGHKTLLEIAVPRKGAALHAKGMTQHKLLL